jgi:hypothetical protein
MRALLVILLIPLVACGGGTFFVGFNTNTGRTTFISGTVSLVQVTVVDGNVNVTIVTLLANNAANSLTLCGNQAGLFPIDGFMQVNFTPARPCVDAFVIVSN